MTAWVCSLLHHTPGTQLFEYCAKNNLLTHKPAEYMDLVDLHYNSNKPHFVPHKLTADDLIAFKKKCEDFINKKRERLAPNLSRGYPIRYEPRNGPRVKK